MRSLGEFFGHIAKGVKSESSPPAERRVVCRETKEKRDGNVVLRRTTIEEIEISRDDASLRSPGDLDGIAQSDQE